MMGQATVPMVIRMPGGSGTGAAAQHCRAAEALLRRKVLEGQAGQRWIEGAIRDHQVRGRASAAALCCAPPLLRFRWRWESADASPRSTTQAVCQNLWQPLVSLAAAWSRAKEAPLRATAGQLYRCLFVGVDSTAHRQEVLQVGVRAGWVLLKGGRADQPRQHCP